MIMFGVMQVTFPCVENHGIPFVNFARRVLLPEAAALLAQADMGLSRNEAITIMRISKDYGMVMHPDDSKDEFEEEYFRDLKDRWLKDRVVIKIEEGQIPKAEPGEPALPDSKVWADSDVECRVVLENGVEILEIMD